MNEPGVLQIASMRGRCTEAEWQARVDLAACYRLTSIYGMTEMVANHISCRVPGSHGQFLINPFLQRHQGQLQDLHRLNHARCQLHLLGHSHLLGDVQMHDSDENFRT